MGNASARIHNSATKSQFNIQQYVETLKKDPSKAKEKDDLERIPLHTALLFGAPTDLISLLISCYGEGLKCKDVDGMLPIHFAASRPFPNTVAVVQLLLEKYVEGAAARTKTGKAALHFALENKLTADVVRMLLSANNDLAHEAYHGKFPLHWALEARCSSEVIKDITVAYPNAIKKKCGNGMYPLHYAAANGKTAVKYLEELVNEHPSALVDKDHKGKLPVHHALERQATKENVIYLFSINPSTTRICGCGGAIPLHMAIERHFDVSVIDLILQYHPEAAGAINMIGILPLFQSLKDKSHDDVTFSLLACYPKAASIVDDYGRVALHYSIARNSASLEVIHALLNAFPTAARMIDNHGQLPLHLAAMRPDCLPEIITALLEYYPEGIMVQDNSGYLPLHYAIENGIDDDVLCSLLAVNPDVTTVWTSNKLLLHFAIEFKQSFRFISEVVKANVDACQEQERTLASRLPIHWAIERLLGEDILMLLLMAYPDCCRVEEGSEFGYLPIHYAVKYKAPLSVVDFLLEAYPDIVSVKNKVTDKLLIHYAAEVKTLPLSLASILRLTMPIHYLNGAPNVNHFYTWTFVLSSTEDMYWQSIEVVLDDFTCIEHLIVLNDAPDEEGNKAVDVATLKCKNVILSRLYYNRRYELKPGPYVHKSKNNLIRIAVDHNDYKRTVALKFMSDKSQFNRELRVRSEFELDADFIVPYHRCYDSDADQDYRAETIAKGYEQYPYCVVLSAGERCLKDIIDHEHIACKDWLEIQSITRQITNALLHLHSKGLIHGDLKPLNVIRMPMRSSLNNNTKDFDLEMEVETARYSLVDMDGCTSFSSGCTAGIQFSSAYCPPEMVYVIPTAQRVPAGQVEENSYDFSGLIACIKADLTGTIKVEEGAPVPPLPYELEFADTSIDMWALGVVLFELCTGMPLFNKSDEDTLDEKSLCKLCEWSEDLKEERLSKIPDYYARNLVHQLLHKDPVRRPSAEMVLEHPFLYGGMYVPVTTAGRMNTHRVDAHKHTEDKTGGVLPLEHIRNTLRLPGQPHMYDIYLCCRLEIDAAYGRLIYDSLLSHGFSVYYEGVTVDDVMDNEADNDIIFMEDGEQKDTISRDEIKPNLMHEHHHKRGKFMVQSRIFMPIFSKASTHHTDISEYNYQHLNYHSLCDVLLFDCRLAMELYDLGMITHVVPILVGSTEPPKASDALEVMDVSAAVVPIGDETIINIPTYHSRVNLSSEAALAEIDHLYHYEYFAEYLGDVIGKFGGCHPHIPEVSIKSLEDQLRVCMHNIKLGVPKHHRGLTAVQIMRSVVTDFDNLVIKGRAADAIGRLGMSVSFIASQSSCQKLSGNTVGAILRQASGESIESNARGVTASTATKGLGPEAIAVMDDALQKGKASEPIDAVDKSFFHEDSAVIVDVCPTATESGHDQVVHDQVRAHTAASYVQPISEHLAVGDVNLLSDRERTTYVDMLRSQLVYKNVEIGNLQEEVARLHALLDRRTDEFNKLKHVSDIPMPFDASLKPATAHAVGTLEDSKELYQRRNYSA